ncbi:MAG: response regulator, partial [Inquilinus sp.]|nr:response regulator [Inquilinus sp.]
RRKLYQDASILRLKARTVSIGGLGPLTHRLEEYLAGIESIDGQKADDLQTFADRIADVLDGKWTEPREVAGVVRDLPTHWAFEVGDVEIAQVEITLVMPQRSAARVVERELAACGYRVSVVLDPFEAIGLINETRPDLVITAQVMPRLSGVDLACALSAMPATRDVPVALLTSLERGHPDLTALPMGAGVIRRGPSFGEDLANVLERFEIT